MKTNRGVKNHGLCTDIKTIRGIRYFEEHRDEMNISFRIHDHVGNKSIGNKTLCKQERKTYSIDESKTAKNTQYFESVLNSYENFRKLPGDLTYMQNRPTLFTAQHSTAQHSTAQHSTAWAYCVLFCVLLLRGTWN